MNLQGRTTSNLPLFAAAGDVSRRPNVSGLVPRLKAALSGRGWVSGRVLCSELGTDLRSLREAGHQSGGDVIGGQKGYALLAETPVAEVRRVIARHLSQSREQRERALETERAFHRTTGEAA